VKSYPPKAHISEEHISAPNGCCAPKFLHALENDQVLLAHPPIKCGKFRVEQKQLCEIESTKNQVIRANVDLP